MEEEGDRSCKGEGIVKEEIRSTEGDTSRVHGETLSQKVTYLFCDELKVVSKELMSRVRQATKDVVKSEV